MAAGRAASAMRVVMDWVKSISIALVAWFLLRTFLIEAFRIPSGSMQNTLLVGDFLFVNKFLYGAEVPVLKKRLPAVREPERGEVIVFDSVEDDIKVVKRLIGVAGDTLEMRSGVVYRNGVKVEEPYAVNSNPSLSADPLKRAQMREWQVQHFAGPVPRDYHPDLHDWGPVVVPQDSLFVMGDNRDDSYDGRYWGFLPRLNVRGTPVLVYFSYDQRSIRSMAFLTEVRWKRLLSTPE
ncbi:MAG TPA: signal peptidase I [Gemmatimonadales bacterium]|jgi:signal peptidase I|nr:signal peptidase I [Gemmatimonadales bacterium]